MFGFDSDSLWGGPIFVVKDHDDGVIGVYLVAIMAQWIALLVIW